MKNKILNIPQTTLDKFYRYAIEILSLFPPLNKLSKKEKELLALLLYYNSIYKELPEKDRYIIIFSIDKRKEMQEILNTNEAVFNNMKSSLRKKGILNENNTINPIYLIEPSKDYQIIFNFKISEL